MRKTRLNRRINAVRKNIFVKKHLLNKLEKIKTDRKGQAPSRPVKRQRTSIRRPSRLIRRPSRSIRSPSRSIRSYRKTIPMNSLKLPYMKKIRKLNDIFPKSRNNLDNMSNNMSNNTCNYKNFHEEHIEIPDNYPGDLWVHHNLVVDRDKPLEYFDEDYLKEVYENHRKICYGV